MLCDDAVRVWRRVLGKWCRGPESIVSSLIVSSAKYLSGIEVRRQLKASHSAIPVIFMTAHEDETLYQQAFEVGFAAYLRKPLSAHQLLDAIE
jgi:CheY-like chemotaxis protein